MTDADSALNMLQEFLSGPDAKDKISEALSMLGSGDFSLPQPEKEQKKETDSDSPLDIDPAKLMKIMSAFKSLENKKDPRGDLLSALKPYLAEEKAYLLSQNMETDEWDTYRECEALSKDM